MDDDVVMMDMRIWGLKGCDVYQGRENSLVGWCNLYEHMSHAEGRRIGSDEGGGVGVIIGVDGNGSTCTSMLTTVL